MTLGNAGGLAVPRLAAPSPLVAARLTASPTRGEASRTPNNGLAKRCGLERQDTPRREASRTPDTDPSKCRTIERYDTLEGRRDNG
jgi:hypothetical protein